MRNPSNDNRHPVVVARELRLLEDNRGWLLKMLMRHHIDAADREFGEIYLTSARTGQVKGNHYHENAAEWFCVVSGQGLLVTKDLKSGELNEFNLSLEQSYTVFVPPNVAHAIKNVGETDMVLLAYSDQPYDPDNIDEKRYELLLPALSN